MSPQIFELKLGAQKCRRIKPEFGLKLWIQPSK